MGRQGRQGGPEVDPAEIEEDLEKIQGGPKKIQEELNSAEEDLRQHQGDGIGVF